MIIFVLLLGLVILGYFLKKNDKTEVPGMMCMLMGGTLLSIALITMPLSRMEYGAAIQKYEVIQHTLEKARENSHELENATLTLHISDINQKIASARYYNDSIFGLWVLDEFAELEYLE